MAVLQRIAYFLGRRDEVPNRDLARSLAASRDEAGIREIARNLRNGIPAVESDCLKVLYEIGYIEPRLIAPYVEELLRLLRSKNNRMILGSMIALSTISALKAREIWGQIEVVLSAIDRGTLITVVWGVKTLSGVASTSKAYRSNLFPILADHLRSCNPRDLPLHAENMLPAIDGDNRESFLALLDARRAELSPSQATRLKKVLREQEAEL